MTTTFLPSRLRGESLLHRAADSAVPAVAGYFLVRLLATGMVWLWAQAQHKSLMGLLGHKFDAVWYLGIIEHGYDHGRPLQSNLAFFPLFPGLVRGLTVLSPVSATATAIAVAWLAGLVTAWGLYTLGRTMHDHRTGVALAVLWGVIPHAVVQSMAYTECLFTALAVWSLYAVLERKWFVAGVLCLLAGLSRPTASALIPVIVLSGLVALCRRQDGWRPLFAAGLAPVGWLGYLAWVGRRVGRFDGWYHIQDDGWKSSWDGGRYTAATASSVLRTPSPLDFYLVTLVLALALLLFVITIDDRQPWQLILFSGLSLTTSLGVMGYYNAKARFLIAAFPLLIPIATGLARTRVTRAIAVLGALTLISGYIGGYLLLVWKYSP